MVKNKYKGKTKIQIVLTALVGMTLNETKWSHYQQSHWFWQACHLINSLSESHKHVTILSECECVMQTSLSALPGSSEPTPCPAGQTQINKGMSSCDPCPVGYYCQSAVSPSLVDCPPYHYCPQGQGKLSCFILTFNYHPRNEDIVWISFILVFSFQTWHFYVSSVPWTVLWFLEYMHQIN